MLTTIGANIYVTEVKDRNYSLSSRLHPHPQRNKKRSVRHNRKRDAKYRLPKTEHGPKITPFGVRCIEITIVNYQTKYFDQPSLACTICGRSYSNTLTFGLNVTLSATELSPPVVPDPADALNDRPKGRKHDRWCFIHVLRVGRSADVEDNRSM